MIFNYSEIETRSAHGRKKSYVNVTMKAQTI